MPAGPVRAATIDPPPPTLPATEPQNPPSAGRQLVAQLSAMAETIRTAAKAPNALSGQKLSLQVLRDSGQLSDKKYEQRLASLELHGDPQATTTPDSGASNWIWSLIHPARTLWSGAWNRLTDADYYCAAYEHLKALRQRCTIKQLTFYAADNVQLSGMLLSLDRRPKPTLLMVVGNADMAENNLDIALRHAQQYDVNVMLFNGRGVGLSLGDITTPEQSLQDVRAAVLRAIDEKQPVVLWGASLGGGMATRVLRDLQAEKHPALTQMRLLVVNSFPDLPAVAGRMMQQRSGLPAGALGGASAFSLRCLGIDPLDSLSTLKDGVGVPTLVINSDSDALMHEQASLARRLQGQASEDVRIIETEAGAHNAYHTYLDNADYGAFIQGIHGSDSHGDS